MKSERQQLAKQNILIKKKNEVKIFWPEDRAINEVIRMYLHIIELSCDPL